MTENNKMSENNKCSLINPYELLGFDSKQPNILMKDLKKQYFTLSLICHPDKGGNADDMIILKNAYQYIKEQIEGKDEKSKDFEIVEEEFKEFMKTQSSNPPPFSQVYEEAHLWLKEFNEEFEKQKIVSTDTNNNKEINEYLLYYNNKNDGYGNLMDTHTDISREDEIKIKPSVEFKSDITIYKTPESFSYNSNTGYDIYKQKITDFSNNRGVDYKKAYTICDTIIDDKEFLKTEIITKDNLQTDSNLKKLLLERKKHDATLYVPIENYINEIKIRKPKNQ